MKEVAVEQAVGTVLAHDITQIIPGQYKGPKFKKGHIIAEEDIPLLLSMGKKHLFVLEKNDTDVHENEAAYRIASKAAGEGIELTEPSEGKIELKAAVTGLLKIDRERLYQLVSQDEIMFATIHENIVVRQGEKLAGTRIIPQMCIRDRSSTTIVLAAFGYLCGLAYSSLSSMITVLKSTWRSTGSSA